MEILIISGLSGSGKSRTAAFLEDIGYYIVDNLPAEMMLKFANFCTASGGRYDRVALVYDVRAGEPFQRLIDVQDKLRRRDNVRCRMLFLEADTRVIISRYKETRRTHPLCTEGGSIEEAVKRERELLDPVRARSDFVLDTTAFSTAKLRSELLNLFGGVGTRQPLNVSVITDEKWLLFVIEQVLSNALKYTRSGSVSITLEAPKTLCIRDTGIGIASEDLPRVFEKGFTGCNGRTDKRATGIGLYLCRRILEKLGHTIAITSTVGEGTTVRICLQQDALEVE